MRAFLVSLSVLTNTNSETLNSERFFALIPLRHVLSKQICRREWRGPHVRRAQGHLAAEQCWQALESEPLDAAKTRGLMGRSHGTPGRGKSPMCWKLHAEAYPAMWIFKLISPREALWRSIVTIWLNAKSFRCTDIFQNMSSTKAVENSSF